MEQFSTDVPVQEVEIKNMKCDIVEDIANCKYLKNGEEEEDIKLVKVDGNWKVDMPKETPNFDDFDFEGDDEDEAILEETPEEV